MFYIKEFKFEAKRSKLMLNCESSKAKQTCSIVEKKIQSGANMFILKNLNIEAKQTRSLVQKFISKRSEHVYM